MPEKYAKIAVADVTYWVDRPYDYYIPSPMAERAAPGMRVLVPFSRGNRQAEGVILSLRDRSDYAAPKSVISLLDDAPVLSPAQLQLALWMRERFYCTVYEAVKAMLPAGVWFRANGTRRVSDKHSEWLRLAIPAEDALALAGRKAARAKQQASVLRLLLAVGEGSSADVRAMTGAGRQALTALRDAGAVEFFHKELFRRPRFRSGAPREALPALNSAQESAYRGLRSLMEREQAACALLQGVTGSGKTAVYIHLIHAAISAGRSAILLVPEIALTPQMLETFSSYFGDDIAVLHSSLSVAERYDEWKRVRAGAAKLVIGTRSAVFAPVERLGLVVIDEEQEDSYKSESAPRYHARDVAKYRCAAGGALLLLGSATPDVVSRYHAETGRYEFFRLDSRFNRMALPEVRVADMKRELRAGNGGPFSSLLLDELQKNLDAGEQSILFLNRRGTAKLVCCVDCGFTFRCPNCSVNLTYHSAGGGRLLCHICGHSRRVAAACPDCGGTLRYSGDGTEQVETLLSGHFPGVALLRADTDSLAQAGSHDALFRRFQTERIPIMIGTQMVTKGLNFDNVTLVGVLLADQSLYAGSYRASERTFSLLTQVIGRGGRAERPGRAVIQTFTPDNEVIRRAAAQDYDGFYAGELELRRVEKCPPFFELVTLSVTGGEEGQVLRCCAALKGLLLQGLGGRAGTEVLGTETAPIVRVMNRYRYRLTLRCRPDRELRTLISKALIHCNTHPAFRGVSVYADANPIE